MTQPLPVRVRPNTLDDVIGQEHITNYLKQNKTERGFILYGKSGIGKTTIAKCYANDLKRDFLELNASNLNKKSLQDAINAEETVVFIDEIHRLDKVKTDLLLEATEYGRILLIGATTENPHFQLRPALLSRLTVFQLNPLTEDQIKQVLSRAFKVDEHLKKLKVKFDDKAFDLLARLASGDGRKSLNYLDDLTNLATPDDNGVIRVTTDLLKQVIPHHQSDGGSDSHYDLLSAFQKSIRGSDANASLYYLARLLKMGELESVCRRLTIIAYEDIGIANPEACTNTTVACKATLRIGLPEARIILAQVVVQLALSPKSNLAYKGIKTAWDAPEKPIPARLRDSHYKGAKDLNHGVGYQYPHDYPFAKLPRSEQTYLPDDLLGQSFIHFDETLTPQEEQLKGVYDFYESTH